MFTCAPHLSLIEAGFIITSWSFSPNKTSKYYGMLGKHPGPINRVLPLFLFFLFTPPPPLSSSPPKPTMEYVAVPGLVSWCICPITQGFKAASHVVMPHRKAPLLSCALCLNKHLSKHFDNHSSLCLNTHIHLKHIHYTDFASAATHGVHLVSGQGPEL